MLVRIKHKELKHYIEKGNSSGLPSEHIQRIWLIMARLEVAQKPEDVVFPGSGLHPLTGEMKGFWAVKVSANWRITFRFEGENITDIDLVDYH